MGHYVLSYYIRIFFNMRDYIVKGRTHYVYDLDEIPDNISYLKDWREGRVDDWVLSDDSCVIQVLRRRSWSNKDVVGTCTGTFTVQPNTQMDTIRRKDIYSLGGGGWYARINEREKPTPSERLFAHRIASGETPLMAYMKVFNSSLDRAKKMSALLIKQERVQKIVREELKDVFEKKGIDLEFLVGAAQDVVSGGKNDSDRLNALKMLWDAFGVVENQKVTQITGLFQGHSLEQLEEAKRPDAEEVRAQIKE